MKSIKKISIMFAIIFLFIALMIGVNASIVANPILDISLVEQDPDPVEPGEFVDLKFNIQNNGNGAAKDLELEIVPEYPFTLYEGENAVEELGDVKVYEATETDTGTVTVRYRLGVDSEALEGIYEITLRYRHGDDTRQWQSIDPFDIRVKSTKGLLSISSTETIPERVEPGHSISINMQLKNEGSNDLEDLKIIAEVTNVTELSPLGSSNELIISRINGGAEENISFNFMVSASAELKTYKLPINLTFMDESGNSYTKLNYISVIVDSSPEYILNLEESEIYQAGTKGSIVISLSNIGSSDINYATLRLSESEEYVALSSSTVYLGNLESDDYETAEFDIYVDDYQPKLPLNFILSYTDNYNNDYDEDITLEMKLFTSSEAGKYGLKEGGSGLFYFVVILVVGGGAGYYYWKKKYPKNKKKK